jgi:Protein of unknown function (DUF2865)
MRHYRILQFSRALLASVLALTIMAGEAHAQSLFDTLFGSAKSAPTPNGYDRQPNRLTAPNGFGSVGVNNGAPYTLRQMPQPRRQNGDDDDDQSRASVGDGGRGHRTVCVRMCDGYYWPVSFSAPRSKFYRDATVCQSSCGTEAKLFHYPASGGQIEDAIDLTGRVYSRLPTAFKYRRALVQGCVCRPAPWSAAEMDRHRVYALNDEAAASSGASANAAGKATPTKGASRPVPQPSGPDANVLVSDAKEDRPDMSQQDMSKQDKSKQDTPRKPAVAASVQPEPTLAQGPRGRPLARVVRDEPTVATTRPAERARRTSIVTQQRLAPAPIPAASAGGSLWGAPSASKYTWPGDAPARVR